MIVFWVVAGVLAAAAAALVLFRAARAAGSQSYDPTPDVYRRQLAEIDELADRGLIGEAERKSAHAEAGRRLLTAADAGPDAWASDGKGRRLVLAGVLAASVAALAIYLALGSVGARDQPYAKRLAAWRSSDPTMLAAPELAAVLTQLTRERPQDPQAFQYLAVAEGASDNPAAAVRAMRRAVELAPDRGDLWELLGEALVAQAGGAVTPEAQSAFQEAVRREPKAVAARFHLARGQVEAGDKAGGVAGWRALLADLPADDPRRSALTTAIAQAEGRPSTARAAVPQDQLPMIQGMVQGLAKRLEANPDDPEGWVRLVRAYAVLGEAAKRDRALAAAKSRYSSNPETLAQLDAAARAEPMQ